MWVIMVENWVAKIVSPDGNSWIFGVGLTARDAAMLAQEEILEKYVWGENAAKCKIFVGKKLDKPARFGGASPQKWEQW